MAGLNYVISGLDLLEDYPNIKEYIKKYNGSVGFMYTGDSYTHYNAHIEKQMSDILDADKTHSGSSWGSMLRGIQSVLNGTYTREFIEQQKYYNEYMRELELLKEKIKLEDEQMKEAQMKESQMVIERDETAEYRIETDTSDKHL